MTGTAATTVVVASIALLCWWAPQASGQCTWTSWATQECNCTDDTYWSVRTCQYDNGTTSYLSSLELEIANCTNHCQKAKSPACVCKTMVLGADNVSWECQDYECFLNGSGDFSWTEWTRVRDCGPSYRSRESSCNWTSASASHNMAGSAICGERCIACITQSTTLNCTAVCGECANTTFSLMIENCSSIYSIEIENVTCGTWNAWLEPSPCRAPTACPSCHATQTRYRYCSITPDVKNAVDSPCDYVATSVSNSSVCYINTTSTAFQVVVPADPKQLPDVLPPVSKRQISKPKVEAKQAVAVGSSMCLVFVGFIVFIVVIDAHSIADEAVNRMGKNLRRACKCKQSSKQH